MASHLIDRGELWKSNVRFLQLQLRDRFRVSVDRLRRRPVKFTDGYFSENMQRWIGRFRDFRRDSLPSSSVFYRKRVSKDLNAEGDSKIVRMLQAVAIPVIGNACYVFMHGLNRVQVYGLEKLHEALLHRPKNRPLLTVSNHVASVDDPFVIASLLPPNVLLDAQNLRWTLCASDRCFKNPMTSAFFRCVKVLPVSRGEGIYQQGMDMAISKLNRGGWVHIFPEGSRSRDGGKTMSSSKRGVGRLVLDSDNIPMVVPFVHTGMQEIMPIGANFPRIGKTVTVLIGDPIQFDDLQNVEATQDISRGKLYDAVASRIGHRLQELKLKVEQLSIEQSIIRESYYCQQKADRVAGLLQQVDWESFGMESYINSELDSTTRKEIKVEQQSTNTSTHETTPARNSSIILSHAGGMVSRIRGYMDPTELMSFATRGLFMNRSKGNPAGIREFSILNVRVGEIRPVKAWKEFLESNALGQWSYTGNTL